MEKVQYLECLTAKDLNTVLVDVSNMINKIYLDCINMSDSILQAQIILNKTADYDKDGE